MASSVAGADSCDVDESNMLDDFDGHVHDGDSPKRLAFQVKWQAKISENYCCSHTEKYLKKSQRDFGGCASHTGEGSMDGTGTTLTTHSLFLKASEMKIIGNGTTVTDLGSGLGLFLTHLALYDACKCISIEIVEQRCERSILELRNLGVLFNQANVNF